MIDILLILPPLGRDPSYSKPPEKLTPRLFTEYSRNTRIPQGLLSIGSFLKPFFNVLIYDPRFDLWKPNNEWFRKVMHFAKNTRLLIGISVMTESVASTVQIIDAIKAEGINAPIVLGGVQPMLFPEQTCSDPAVDFVISGDGEEPMLQLASALDSGARDFSSIPGLTWKSTDGMLHTNPQGRPFDINRLFVPDYSILENAEGYMKKMCYSKPGILRGTDYCSSRGCPYQCSFCINSILPANRYWRGRSPYLVIEDLKHLSSKYGTHFMWIEEELPFCDIKRSRTIADLVLKEGLDIEYRAQIRADEVLKMSNDDLAAIHRAGFIECGLGLESGSDRILKYMNKGITARESIAAVKRLASFGIFISYLMMMYIPGENYQDRMLTRAMVKQLKKIVPNYRFHGVAPYMPFPGSSMYADALKYGLKEPQTFREWAGLKSSIYNTPRKTPWVTDYSWRDSLRDAWWKLQFWGLKDVTTRIVDKIAGGELHGI